jgi:signal transduction histidine kinase
MMAIPTASELELGLQRRMLWLMGPMLVLVGVVYFAVAVRSGIARFPWASTTMVASGLAGIAVALTTGRYRLGIEVVIVGMFAAFTYASLNQQGIYSSSLWWLCLPPVFLLLAGSLWLALVLGVLLLGLMCMMAYMGPHPIGSVALVFVNEEAQMLGAELGSTVALLLVSAVCVYWRLELERALAQAREAAAEATEAKARFVARLSHEIRTPLNGLIAATDVIREGRASEAQKRQLQAVQEQSAAVLLSLVNDILDLSKMEAGKFELEERLLRVRALVFGVNELYSVQAFNKGIDLTSSCAADVPVSVRGDATRLRQILCNFVSNAVKFTARGGVHIQVLIDDRAPSDGLVLNLLFRVSDSGPGISPEEIANLFRPYEQGSARVARQHGGTGLGLAICDELARLMGGRIEVASVPGRGSAFTLAVPLKIDAGSAPLHPVRTGRRALVAAATEGLALHVEGVLDALGVDVVGLRRLPDRAAVARSGATIVFVDAGLLGQGGNDAARLADLQGTGAHVIVIAPLGPQVPGLALTGPPVIYKPVRRSSVQAVLAALARQDRAGDGAHPGGVRGDPAHPGRGAAPREGMALHVLVVDDNPVNQIVIQAMLVDLGCTVVQVSNGADAVEACRRGAFDAVLMDIEMPGMDGIETTRAIRELEARNTCPPVPIIAITGVDRHERWPDCRAAGMNDFVAKPLHLESLKRLLRRVTQ